MQAFLLLIHWNDTDGEELIDVAHITAPNYETAHRMAEELCVLSANVDTLRALVPHRFHALGDDVRPAAWSVLNPRALETVVAVPGSMPRGKPTVDLKPREKRPAKQRRSRSAP